MSSEQIMAPRITAAYLERFQNHTVRILGKVTSLRGDNATLDSAGEVNLILNRVFTPSPILLFPRADMMCVGGESVFE